MFWHLNAYFLLAKFCNPPGVRVRATVKLSAAFLHDESSITKAKGGREGRGRGWGVRKCNSAKFLASHVYFHFDDSELWKQYQSLSHEMMGQICDIETVEPQESPIKVCVKFYNIEICYRR